MAAKRRKSTHPNILFPLKERYSLQVNNVAQELLGILLLPLMMRTAKAYNTTPRIVVVSSGAHYWCKFPFQLLEDDRKDGKGFHEVLSTFEYERYGIQKSMLSSFI